MAEDIRRIRKMRVKCFGVADRWFERFVRYMRVLHEGFWLACLSTDDLNAVTAEHFDQSRYYTSTEHNRSGFFEWEKYAVDRFFRPGSRVLVAGAGGGREVLALRGAHFDAEGFECNLALVRASQKLFHELGESEHVIHCPPDCVPLGPPIYDALIVGWTVYTHIPTKHRRTLFLKALHQRALPHAPLLISFFVRPNPSSDEALVHRTARFYSFFFGGRELSELGDRISFARYIHSFTKDELEEELRAARFRVVHYAEEGELGYAVGFANS